MKSNVLEKTSAFCMLTPENNDSFYQLRTQTSIQSIYVICGVDKIQILVIVPSKFRIVENRITVL